MEPAAARLNTEWSTVEVLPGPSAPSITYWGSPRPDRARTERADASAATDHGLVHGSMPLALTIDLLPEHATGTPFRPGVLGHRADGTAWSPVLRTTSVETAANAVVLTAVDGVAGLTARIAVSLGELLSVVVTLTNDSPEPYFLTSLLPTIGLPAYASEIIEFGGRWANELQETRRAWTPGTISVENRRGRTSHDHFPLVVAGEQGFDESHGEVWGLHLAWSGNHHMLAHALADGRRAVQFGELLHPGEVVLGEGESYTAPTLLGTYSQAGLTPASWQFHRYVRSLPGAPKGPRPVIANTWEAMYFDHRPERVRALASTAASLGIERFVLDDGWFSSRRNDSSGLGDWTVSNAVYPDGLEPLIDHVHALGMEFGLWVEPEMMNPDSDLFRAHPEWVLATAGYPLVLGRNQAVVDLTNDDAFGHVYDSIEALLSSLSIDFLKWDMNRDHVQASSRSGRAASHRQTLAVYRMIDALRQRHPQVEIETCSSGGGRMDLGMVSRTQRVWVSDCNDALDRQRIQRNASILLPPEYIGAHIGPERSHTTGRRHDLSFRAATAFFGHLGTELDLLALDPGELERLAQAIAVHRRFRYLLHGGDTVRLDHADPAFLAHGVYSADRSEALISIARLATSASLITSPLRLPGLSADRLYTVRIVPVHHNDRPRGPAVRQPMWVDRPVTLDGAFLGRIGLQPPVLWPEQAVLVHLTG